MNYISALLVCKLSKTPVRFRELRNIRKKEKELAPFLHAIVLLNKGEVAYDREKLTNYYLKDGNIKNIALGLVIAKKIEGRFTALSSHRYGHERY